jgi:hypothetical protein
VNKYNISIGFPERSCVDLIYRVVFEYIPNDEIVRALRRAAYQPEFMVASDPDGKRYYFSRLKEIMQVVDEVPDSSHPLILEVKKIVVAFYKTMEATQGQNPVGDLPQKT